MPLQRGGVVVGPGLAPIAPSAMGIGMSDGGIGGSSLVSGPLEGGLL